MKRHVQETGIRKWYGDDFVSMQQECMDAIEAMVQGVQPFALSGCMVSSSGIDPGIVVIWVMEYDEVLEIDTSRSRIARFEGYYGTMTFPCYIEMRYRYITRPYQTGGSKNIIKEYYAVLINELTGNEAITIPNALYVIPGLYDVIQGINRRFVTDAEKAVWNAKIAHGLATAANDFLVASGASSFVKKTLAEVKSILGLGSAAYKNAGTGSDQVSFGNHVHDIADAATNGFMSAVDKLKINRELNKAVGTHVDGATIYWNMDSVIHGRVTLGGNRVLSITNVQAGDYGTIVVMQDGSGGRTLTLPAGSKMVNGGFSLSTEAYAVDILTFFYDGTNYYWSIGNNYV